MPGTLRLVLGDQLSDNLSSLRDIDAAVDVVLMAEVMAEAEYVRHHKQKLVLVFSAMRQFAERLEARGVAVRYIRLDAPDNSGSLNGEVLRAIEDQPFERVVVTEAGEWRLAEAFRDLDHIAPVPVEVREDDRYLCSHAEFAGWAGERKAMIMEFFYREMRRKFRLLMDGDKPAGGQWNLDRENRKGMAKGVRPPQRMRIAPNPTTREVMTEVATRFADNFGGLEEFAFATNQAEADAVVDHFITNILPGFGDHQDAMSTGHPWMWHAIVSAAMNVGLIDPLEICRRAEAEWRVGRAPLNAVEGFVRQIIGWREYMRGVYWLKMPQYAATNALGADRRLPWFYWSAETDMACVRDVVEMTRDHAYAHHIQRLMITGNLAMLLGVAPAEINDWYMVVYADAYDWVELPNTHGMATFADGGIVGSKPYAAAGAYINRMSDYCGGCRYDPKLRLEDNACPYNALYWDFLDQHEEKLAPNGRMQMPYRTLGRMSDADRAAIRAKAEATRQAFGAVAPSGGNPAPASA